MLAKVQEWTALLGWWIPIIALVLTAIVNALRKYKQTGSVLDALIDLLSPFTRKDSPGTLKLPLTRSKPPANANGVEEVRPRASVRGHADFYTLVGLAVFSLLLISTPACASARFRSGPALDRIVDCGGDTARGAIATFAPTVEKILLNGDPDWNLALLEVEKLAGGALVCVVQSIIDNFSLFAAGEAPISLGLSEGAAVTQQAIYGIAAARGQRYLRSTGYVPIQP